MQTEKDIVSSIFPIISLDEQLIKIERFIDRKVIVFMDNKVCSTSLYWWYIWVAFLHKTATMNNISGLNIKCHKVEEIDGKYQAKCQWLGKSKNEEIQSSMFELVYAVKENKITHIWTKKKNYTLIHGDKLKSLIWYKFTIAKLLFFSVFSNINKIKQMPNKY